MDRKTILKATGKDKHMMIPHDDSAVIRIAGQTQHRLLYSVLGFTTKENLVHLKEFQDE